MGDRYTTVPKLPACDLCWLVEGVEVRPYANAQGVSENCYDCMDGHIYVATISVSRVVHLVWIVGSG